MFLDRLLLSYYAKTHTNTHTQTRTQTLTFFIDHKTPTRDSAFIVLAAPEILFPYDLAVINEVRGVSVLEPSGQNVCPVFPRHLTFMQGNQQPAYFKNSINLN